VFNLNYLQWLIQLSIRLTLLNTMFNPHSVFTFLVCTQTVSISLYSINWLVCITETECVYCAVRTGSYVQIRWNSTLKFGLTMTQAVSGRPLTVEIRVRSQLSPYEICGRHNNVKTCSLTSTSGFPYQYQSPSAPDSCLHVDHNRRTKGEAWKTSKKKTRNSDIGDGRVLTIFSALKD
jgi:hypothetical protein